MRLGSEAVAYALKLRAQNDPKWKGWCLVFVRTCLDIGGKYPSAINAWTHVAPGDRHGGGAPPPGVPVFWKVGAFGHVALSAGGGYCYSTDILRRGLIDKVKIDYISTRWNAHYLGWSETLNGQRVWTPDHAVPHDVTVHLTAVQQAAATDPGAPQGHTTHPDQVQVVEKALVAEGLLDDRWLDGSWGTKTTTAWRRWQQRIGTEPTGRPEPTDLDALGKRYGFPVTQ